MNDKHQKSCPQWSKENWQNFPRVQQPVWKNQQVLQKNLHTLSKLPPLVFAGEILQLKNELKKVERGEAFILQGGDCAETFEQCDSVTIRENLKLMLQMAFVLTYAGSKRIVKVGRVAGQYAKPRSQDFETIDGQDYPSYRGDMINSEALDQKLREPDSDRMLEAYFRSAATLNLLRAFTKGGFASLENVHRWNKEFVTQTPQGKKYNKLAKYLENTMGFMRAVGLNATQLNSIAEVDYYTSHEGLILEYEQALTRFDSITNRWYDCSGHLLWIGDRTRQLNGAHINFFQGVENPIGIKVGTNHNPEEIAGIIECLNPKREAGKIVLISRFGAGKVEKFLMPLLKILKNRGLNCIFSCDPMHANTYKVGKYKTRDCRLIYQEITEVNQILESESLHLGGIHIEITGLNVTECIDGDTHKDAQSLDRNYATSCDPRLNATQSLELAFQLAQKLHDKS